MRNFIINTVLVCISCVVAILLFEGGLAYVTGKSFIQKRFFATPTEYVINPVQPSQSPQTQNDALPSEHTKYLATEDALQQLKPVIEAEMSLFGNQPDTELVSQNARLSYSNAQGALRLHANAKYQMAFIRSVLFNAWDPLVWLRKNEKPIASPELANFLDTYAYGVVEMAHDANGNRVTPNNPSVTSDIVLVVGDSVAYGAGVNDNETLSYVLQERYPGKTIVNAGIPGVQTKDITTRLEELIEQYKDRVSAVVYVHCLNDFSDKIPPVEVAEMIEMSMSGLPDDVEKVFVSHVYVYQSMPDIMRRNDAVIKLNMEKRRDLISEVEVRGFHIVDTLALIEQYKQRFGSPLAGFSLYVDHCHWSYTGNKLVADAINLQ